MIRVEIGEVLIKYKNKGFFGNKYKTIKLIPSFENIAKIGDSEHIIDAYSTLLNERHIQLVELFHRNLTDRIISDIKAHINKQYEIAKLVIACCANDDTRNLKLGIDNAILIAIALLRYGVSGNAKVRVSQRNESKQYQSEFDINQYINSARIHLGLSFDEAKKLTMTEYILLMSKKFPDNDSLTSKEYDEVMAEYKKNKAERLRKAQQSKET